MCRESLNGITIFDTENNGLLYDATRSWVISIMKDGVLYSSRNVEQEVKKLEGVLVGHNICGYDIPLMKKLFGVDYNLDNLIDTEVLSRLFNPDRQGGHSLEAWGERVGISKVPDLDWTKWDDGMIDRCEQDVRINEAVYHLLEKEKKGHDWGLAIWIEKNIAALHAQQVLNGVQFDIDYAKEVLKKINDELEDIDNELHEKLPKRVIQGSTVLNPFRKSDGKLTKRAEPYSPWGPFSKVEIEDMNLNSHEQVKAYLLTQGWQPTEWTKPSERHPEGSPKLTEDSYGTIKGNLAQKLSRRSILSHRASLISGLIGGVRDSGRIGADAITNGTNTGRYTHITVVNIPKAKPHVVYGIECRSMFVAAEGKVLVGTDAKALEARMEAHYTYPYDGGKYAAELIDGDIHSKNAEVFHTNRDLAKNGKYCLLYGGQPKKLSKTINKPLKEAKQHFDNFWKQNRALGLLKNDLEKVLTNRDYVVTLDGRKIFIRSKHSALNALFQSAGSILVKYATILMNQRLTKAGIEYKQVIHNHDEVVFEMCVQDTVLAIEIIHQCWIDAGEFFKVWVPIEGDVKVGKNWAEVH